jgi:hypothetical protein
MIVCYCFDLVVCVLVINNLFFSLLITFIFAPHIGK